MQRTNLSGASDGINLGLIFRLDHADANSEATCDALERGFTTYFGLGHEVGSCVRVEQADAARFAFLLHLNASFSAGSCHIGYRLEDPADGRQILVGSIVLPADLASMIAGDEADRIACPVEYAILLECAAGRTIAGDAAMRRSEALRFFHVPEEGHREAALALLHTAQTLNGNDPGVLTSLARLELELLGDVIGPAAYADRVQDIVRLAEKARLCDSDRPIATVLLAMAHLRSGRATPARALLAQLSPDSFRLPDIAVLAAELGAYLGQLDETHTARAVAALCLHPAPPDWWRQSLIPVMSMADEPNALVQARMTQWPTLATLAWHAILAERQGVGSEAREAIGRWHARWGSDAIVGNGRRRAAATAWLRRAVPFIENARANALRDLFLQLAGMS